MKEKKLIKVHKTLTGKMLLAIFSWSLFLFLFSMLMCEGILKNSYYVEYYFQMIMLFMLLSVLVLIIIVWPSCGIFYWAKQKKYIWSIVLSIVVCSILGLIGLSIHNETGIVYKFIQSCDDFKYVKNNSYCEKVETLKRVYDVENHGKSTTISKYIDTTNFTFNMTTIKNENEDEFLKKYKIGKKARLRYLPKTNILLEVEAISD